MTMLSLPAVADRRSQRRRERQGSVLLQEAFGPGASRDMGAWLIFAAFLPYLIKSNGLRGEQVIIYVLGGIGVVRLMTSHARRPAYLGPIVGFFGLAALWVLGITLMTAISEVDNMRVIAETDHYLRPGMITVALVAWITVDHRERALASLRRASVVLLGLLAFNGVVTALSLFADIGGVLEPFRSLSEAGDLNVAELSLQSGRLTGLFNQPFETGVAYSIGLFAWAYLFTGKGAFRPRAGAYVILASLIVGGVLPASKAFLLGGLPIFIIYWIATGGLAGIIKVRSLPIVAAAVVIVALIVANWPGGDVLVSQYQETASGERGLLSFLSAGRFGEEALVTNEFVRVAQDAPLTGFGLDSFGPLDNAYFMYFIHGGLLPLMGYLFLLGWLVAVAMRFARSSREGQVLGLLVIYMIGAGLGAPVASIPRASTLLWVMVVLLLIAVGGRRLVPTERGVAPPSGSVRSMSP